MPDALTGPRRPIPPAPIHPLAALTTIVLDNIFNLPDVVGLAAPELYLIVTPIVGGLGFLSTMFVQRYLAKDSWGASVAKGLVMGIIAGVPFSVTGTAVGVPLLAWAGLHEWIKLPAGKAKPEDPAAPGEGEVVDGEVRDVK